MMRWPRLAALAVTLFVLAPALGEDGEMKAECHFDGSNPRVLKTKFGKYGYHPTQTIRPEQGCVRFWLPAKDGTTQTGLYSLFAMAGDCEVIITYEFLKLPPPKKGYGSGIGIAFDLGEGGESGFATMQRVDKPKEGRKYIVQTQLPGEKEVYDPKPAVPKTGRIGLRRIKKELLFLASDAAVGELEEIDRLPFPDLTVRKVRVFADTGGSPTGLDARVFRIEVRSLEMTGGIPDHVPDGPNRWWLWLLTPALLAGFAFWIWRLRKMRVDRIENPDRRIKDKKEIERRHNR